MAFTKEEKQSLLTLKGVGETVIKRLEQIGIDSFEKLATSNVEEITEIVADILQTTCWKNSPQAKSAIQNAIDCARSHE